MKKDGVDTFYLRSKKKVYRFDLTQLEKELHTAYLNYEKKDNEDTRTELFKKIYDLAFAILNVGTHIKTGTDHEENAYEYALYLFERIVTKNFIPDHSGGMPWQRYIDLNIRHIVYTRRENNNESWLDFIDDMEFLLSKIERYDDIFSVEKATAKLDRNEMAKKLYESLKIFYNENEIERLLPLSIELIYSDGRRLISKNVPNDIKDFTMVIISMAKRLASNYNIESNDLSTNDLRKILASTTRSSVFLSSVINSSFFPKELLFGLDIDSIYRLVNIAGGKKIRIPTQWELNTLVGTVVAASKMIIDNKTDKQSLQESKKDYDLVFSFGINVQNLVSKIVKTLDIFSEDPKSGPLINTVFLSISNASSLLDKLLSKVNNREINAKTKESCLELTKTVDNLIGNISKSNEQLKRKLNE